MLMWFHTVSHASKKKGILGCINVNRWEQPVCLELAKQLSELEKNASNGQGQFKQ